MRQTVDEGVVGTGGLSHQTLKFRSQRRNGRLISPSSHNAEDHVRGPREQPQSDVHDGNFSDANFSRHLILFSTSQGSDVHFLGLLTHFIFVLEHSLHDEEIAAHDDEDRDEVNEGGVEAQVDNVVLVEVSNKST